MIESLKLDIKSEFEKETADGRFTLRIPSEDLLISIPLIFMCPYSQSRTSSDKAGDPQ
jgi:hypothetical protein